MSEIVDKRKTYRAFCERCRHFSSHTMPVHEIQCPNCGEPIMDEWDAWANDRDEKYVAKMTSDWLEVLIHAARKYGWTGDYTEVRDFVEWCHGYARNEVSWDLIKKPEPIDDEETTNEIA